MEWKNEGGSGAASTSSSAVSATVVEQRSAWQIAVETFADLPEDDLSEIPTDGAEQHDHYLYGWPKKDLPAKSNS